MANEHIPHRELVQIQAQVMERKLQTKFSFRNPVLIVAIPFQSKTEV